MWQLSKKKLHAKFDVQLAPWLGAGLGLGLLGLHLLPGVRVFFWRADYKIIFGYDEASGQGRTVAQSFLLLLLLSKILLVVLYVVVGFVAKKAVPTQHTVQTVARGYGPLPFFYSSSRKWVRHRQRWARLTGRGRRKCCTRRHRRPQNRCCVWWCFRFSISWLKTRLWVSWTALLVRWFSAPTHASISFSISLYFSILINVIVYSQLLGVLVNFCSAYPNYIVFRSIRQDVIQKYGKICGKAMKTHSIYFDLKVYTHPHILFTVFQPTYFFVLLPSYSKYYCSTVFL